MLSKQAGKAKCLEKRRIYSYVFSIYITKNENVIYMRESFFSIFFHCIPTSNTCVSALCGIVVRIRLISFVLLNAVHSKLRTFTGINWTSNIKHHLSRAHVRCQSDKMSYVVHRCFVLTFHQLRLYRFHFHLHSDEMGYKWPSIYSHLAIPFFPQKRKKKKLFNIENLAHHFGYYFIYKVTETFLPLANQ